MTIVAATLASGLAAFGLTSLQTKYYRAQASLELQGYNKYISADDFTGSKEASISLADVSTEMEVLRSHPIIERALGKLNLDRYKLHPRNSQAVQRDSGEKRKALLDSIDQYMRVAAVPDSRVITVSYSSPDPRFSADLLNALLDQAVADGLERRLTAGQRTTEWLAQQVSELRHKLEASQDELNAYARSTGLLYTRDNDNIAEDKLKQIQQELSNAQADRMAKQSRYEAAISNRADVIPEVSAAIRDYQVHLDELRRRLAEEATLLKPAHYKIQQLNAQIGELQSTIERERSNALGRIATELISARKREQLLRTAYASQAGLLSAQSERATRYNMLRREVETNRQLYQSILQKVKEANIASALRSSNLGIIDSAEVPTAPYQPRPIVNTSVGIATGLFLGSVLALVRARADRKLRSPGELTACLGLPELGVIPSRAIVQPSIKPAWPNILPFRGRHLEHDPIELATVDPRPSEFTEAFRTTVASILLGRERGVEVIAVTSPGPGVGKTTAVCNLGIALSRIGKRVLLVDGDMRRPRLDRVFGFPNECGLSTLLSQNAPLDREAVQTAIRATNVRNLHLIASGPLPDSAPELFHSPRLKELLTACRRDFDAVIIDTPPVLEICDARLLGRAADAVLLVCRAGYTDRDSAIAAVHLLSSDGAPVLGTILSHWVPGGSRYYGYGRYYKQPRFA
jgi:capsular exopolysaccharide synthesis family protein